MKDEEKAPEGWTFCQTRVLVPALEESDLEWLKDNEPFAVLAELEEGAQFVGLAEIPTLQDMLGLPGPSGLFAYAYQVDPEVTEKAPVMFLSSVVGERVCLPDLSQADVVSWRHLGVQATSGMLCAHFAMWGPGLAPFVQEFKDKGVRVLDAKDYKVPKEILSEALRRRHGQAS